MAQTQKQRIFDLEAEVQELQAEARKATRVISSNKKIACIFRALKQDIKAAVTPLKPLPQTKPWLRRGMNLIEEHAVSHWSDFHMDEIVLPHQVGGLEDFNFTVGLARCEKLVRTILKFTQITLSNYRFPVLNILSYGDHSSGILHGSVDRSEYRNQFKNCLAIGQAQALMVRDLAPYFKQVNVLAVSGNHGRQTPKKDYNNPTNNFDYLIAEIAAQHTRDIRNVTWSIPDTFCVNVDILGHTYCVFHGDDIQSFNGIPYYGISRKTQRLTALQSTQNKKIDVFCMGHFHRASSLCEGQAETIINGSLKATDSYSFNAFSGYTEPCQWLNGCHAEHPITWRLKCNLKRKDGRPEVPERYKVLLADPKG